MSKLLAFFAAILVVFSTLSLTVSADSVDTDFSIYVTATPNASTAEPARKKDNTTSSYVNYTKGPTKFIAIIYGSRLKYGFFYDCTTYEYYQNFRRPDAVVTKGTKGFVRQDVYEAFGVDAWAQIYGKQYNSLNSTASGKWSADSVYESGCVEYN